MEEKTYHIRWSLKLEKTIEEIERTLNGRPISMDVLFNARGTAPSSASPTLRFRIANFNRTINAEWKKKAYGFASSLGNAWTECLKKTRQDEEAFASALKDEIDKLLVFEPLEAVIPIDGKRYETLFEAARLGSFFLPVETVSLALEGLYGVPYERKYGKIGSFMGKPEAVMTMTLLYSKKDEAEALKLAKRLEEALCEFELFVFPTERPDGIPTSPASIIESYPLQKTNDTLFSWAAKILRCEEDELTFDG